VAGRVVLEIEESEDVRRYEENGEEQPEDRDRPLDSGFRV
jgi:hypothetical protein